jgi:6-phosphogluconolactonase
MDGTCLQEATATVGQAAVAVKDTVTFSLPMINASRQVALLMMGDAKAEVASRVLECQSLPGALPAQMVRPVGGTLHYMLDQASASQLPVAGWSDWKLWPRSEIPK